MYSWIIIYGGHLGRHLGLSKTLYCFVKDTRLFLISRPSQTFWYITSLVAIHSRPLEFLVNFHQTIRYVIVCTCMLHWRKYKVFYVTCTWHIYLIGIIMIKSNFNIANICHFTLYFLFSAKQFHYRHSSIRLEIDHICYIC